MHYSIILFEYSLGFQKGVLDNYLFYFASSFLSIYSPHFSRKTFLKIVYWLRQLKGILKVNQRTHYVFFLGLISLWDIC